jgi:glycine/D-amino acid oxidase-like deaminating enzyme
VDTGHTTAHLTMVTDSRLTKLERAFGRTHAQAVWDAGLAAIAQVDEIIREHEIECAFEWVPGYLHAPGGKASRDQIDEFRTDAGLATDLGFDAVFVEDVPSVGGPGIRFDNQARFHPRRYLAGLAQAARENGAHIFEHSEVDEFTDKPLGLKANGHTVRARDIVLATHNPLVGVSGMVSATAFQTKLALYTSYVVAGRCLETPFPMHSSGIPEIRTSICGWTVVATTTWSSSVARITRRVSPPIPVRAMSGSRPRSRRRFRRSI